MLAGGVPWASGRDLLVGDTDAHLVTPSLAGAVYGIDLADPPSASPEVVAAADTRPDFSWIQDVTVSPLDDAIHVLDLGTGAEPPRLHVLCPGPMRVRTLGPPATAPYGIDALPNGLIVIADGEADPAGLGPDGSGGLGPGAVLLFDAATSTLTIVSDGTLHDPMPGLVGPSAFASPTSVVFDALRNEIFVTDSAADPLNVGAIGAVYRVRPSDGHVAVLASTAMMRLPVGIALRPDGLLVVVQDPGIGSCIAWEVDPDDPSPSTNARAFSGGAQVAELTDVAVGADGTVYLADIGEWDPGSGSFAQDPAIWRVDESRPDPYDNVVPVCVSTELFTPRSIVARAGCTPELPVIDRLAINRGGARTVAEVQAQCAPACRVTPFRICPEQLVDQPLDGLTLLGEAVATGTESVWLYEHVEAVRDLHVAKRGRDLVFAAR